MDNSQHGILTPAVRQHGSSPTGVSPTRRFADAAIRHQRFRRSAFHRWVVRRMAVCHFRACDLSLHHD